MLPHQSVWLCVPSAKGTKHSPSHHHLKISNRPSNILVFAVHNRCILNNLGVRFFFFNESLKNPLRVFLR